MLFRSENVPPAGVADKVFVVLAQIPAVVVVCAAVPANPLTVNVTSDVVAGHAPLAAIVYRIVTVVSAVALIGVYVVPAIAPPPETIEYVPPAGVADNVFVPLAQMAAVVVVCAAVPANPLTVNVTSDVVAGQAPFAAIV